VALLLITKQYDPLVSAGRIMIYYDTNQWHWVRDATAYHEVCDTIMLRACWRDGAGVFRIDSRFVEDRGRFADLAALGHYQRVWDGCSPECQADFYADTTGPLPANEWPMVDIETGVSDPADFLMRWLARYESRQQRRAAVYAPLVLWEALLPVIGDRLKVTPSYSRAPWWGPYDVWQDSQDATFPGGSDAGDRNRTDLNAAQILARTSGQPCQSHQCRVQLLND
jgi:hypothetical protein